MYTTDVYVYVTAVIARHMRWGRQEDAHEFLRYMVEAMHKSCIGGHQM